MRTNRRTRDRHGGDLKSLSRVLPPYPRTPHLPWQPDAAAQGDLIARALGAQVIFVATRLIAEEKIDGANLGLRWDGRAALIRNRDHVLSKSYQRKETPAKLQFRPAWNWVYAHRRQLERLAEELGFVPSLYGEWVYARHTLPYRVPDWLIAFELYDPERRLWLDAEIARRALEAAGLQVPPLLHTGPIASVDQLLALRDGPSAWGDRREGCYIKVSDGVQVIRRFKMVRRKFQPSAHMGTPGAKFVRQARL